MVSNGLGSDGTPVFVSPMPSVSATSFGPLGVTFAVWFVIGSVTAEGAFTLEVEFVGGGGAGVAGEFSAVVLSVKAKGIAVVRTRMAKSKKAAVNPLRTSVLFAKAPSISDGDFPRISRMN